MMFGMSDERAVRGGTFRVVIPEVAFSQAGELRRDLETAIAIIHLSAWIGDALEGSQEDRELNPNEADVFSVRRIRYGSPFTIDFEVASQIIGLLGLGATVLERMALAGATVVHELASAQRERAAARHIRQRADDEHNELQRRWRQEDIERLAQVVEEASTPFTPAERQMLQRLIAMIRLDSDNYQVYADALIDMATKSIVAQPIPASDDDDTE